MAGLFDNESGDYLPQSEVEKGMWFIDPENQAYADSGLYIVTLYDPSQDCWLTENVGPDDEVMDRINELCRAGLNDSMEGRDEMAQILNEEFGLSEVSEAARRFDEKNGYFVA